MSPSDSVRCLLAWILHTNVSRPGKARIRPPDLTFQLNNYKLKRITPTFYTHYKVIRGWTPWTRNYITEMLIFWSGVLSCCIKPILTMIKFTTWHRDISTGRPVNTWFYQILTANGVMDSVFKSPAVSHLRMRLSRTPASPQGSLLWFRVGQNPDVLANSGAIFKRPDFQAETNTLGIIPDSMKKMLHPSYETVCIPSAEDSHCGSRVYPGEEIGLIESIN